MNATQAVRALSALAHEARLAVFKLLVEAGPAGLPAGVIAEKLLIAPSALTFHLKELTSVNLLVQRPEGRKIYYAAHFDSMNAVVAYLTDNCCGGAACAIDPALAIPYC